MLPAKNRLRGERAFTRLFRQGRRVHGKYATLVFAPTYFGHSRFGIVAGLAVEKRATERNRIRRQYSAIIYHTIKSGLIKGGVDFAVLVKPQAIGKTAKDLEQDFVFCLNKAKFSRNLHEMSTQKRILSPELYTKPVHR